MGRGRQKAKQTKVARKLKYYTPDTDYRALERELSGAPNTDEDLTDQDLAELAELYNSDDDDDDGWDQPDDSR